MFVIRFAGRVKIVKTVRWTLSGVWVKVAREGIGAAPFFLSRSLYDNMILPSATEKLRRKRIGTGA